MIKKICLGERENTIFNYLVLKGKEGATTLDLIWKCGNTRPANEISTMRKKGVNIIGEWETNERTGKRYIRYYLLDYEEIDQEQLSLEKVR